MWAGVGKLTVPIYNAVVGTAPTQEEIQRVSDLYKTCKLVKGQLFVLSVPGRLETTAKYVAQ